MDQDRLGLFSHPGSLHVGDPFPSSTAAASTLVVHPAKGKQILSSPPKKGKTADVTFTKFTSLYQGDKYVTQDELDRKYQLEKKAKQIGKPFRPSSPPKKPTGLGSHYGTLGKPWPNERTTDLSPLTRADVSHEKRNILTAPSKRGTYGMPGLNIGYASGAGSQGIVGEYKYYPETNGGRPQSEGGKISTKAWRPNSPGRKGTYGVSNTGLFSTYKYETDPYKNPRYVSSHDLKGVKPFKPSHPPRKGATHGTINHFPTYIGDPEKEKFERERAQSKELREKLLGPVFRPSSGSPKSTRVVSITNHPLWDRRGE